MKIITGNILEYLGKENSVICVSTNGTVNNYNGEITGVMGAGLAGQLEDEFPELVKELGNK